METSKYIWMDDCTGVVHSCHENRSKGDRKETYVGEIYWNGSVWLAKINQNEKQFKLQRDAMNYIEAEAKK